MTKRIHAFGEQYNKKQKLDGDIDALWGDDLDESVLDDCIKVATQLEVSNNLYSLSVLMLLLNQEKFTCNASTTRNKTLSYTSFKQPSTKIYSSTQLEPIFPSQPGTSKNLLGKENFKGSTKDYEVLQQSYQEKEGEVTVLRTQLKETKAQFIREQNKLQTEWNNKFVLTEKQVQSTRSELEFKVNIYVNYFKTSGNQFISLNFNYIILFLTFGMQYFN